MKNLLLTIVLLLPMFLFAQDEEIKTYKNHVGIASYINNSDLGLSIDYRRMVSAKNEVVFGLATGIEGTNRLSVGYRRHFNTSKKLDFALGFDTSFRRNLSDSFSPIRLSNFPLARRSSMNFLIGAYYPVSKRIDFMVEAKLKPVFSNFLGRLSNDSNLKLGIKYAF